MKDFKEEAKVRNMNRKDFLKLVDELERQAPRPSFVPQTYFEPIDLAEELEKLRNYKPVERIVNPWTYNRLIEMGLISEFKIKEVDK